MSRFARYAFVLAMVLIMLREGAVAFRVARGFGDDFYAYYTAASMVRSGQSPAIYEAATRNVDPAAEMPPSDSVFARVGHAHGISYVLYYDYPPTLADLLVPLTYLSPAAAFRVWSVLNCAALLCAGFLLLRMPGLNLSGWAVPVLGFLVIFPPTVLCLLLGQVPIALLLLLVAGIGLFLQGMRGGATFFFALAAAIKLTPLVVIVPLFAWREWKALRSLALWSMAIAAAILAINGPRTLSLYLFHELPHMAGNPIVQENRTLNSVVQVLWLRFARDASPLSASWVGKLLSALVLCYAGWLARPKRKDPLKPAFQAEALAIFLLLSCCVAPVSWWHAYVLCAPILVIWGKRAWERRSTWAETAALGLFLLLLSTNRSLQQGLLTPVLGIALGILGLHRLARRRDLNDAIPPPVHCSAEQMEPF